MKLFTLLIVCLIETGRASPVTKRQIYAAAGPVTHYEDTIVPFAEYGLPHAEQVLVTPGIVAPVEAPAHVEVESVYAEPPAPPALQPLPEIQIVESHPVEVPAVEYGPPVVQHVEVAEVPAIEYGVPVEAPVVVETNIAAAPELQSLTEIHAPVVVETPAAAVFETLPQIHTPAVEYGTPLVVETNVPAIEYGAPVQLIENRPSFVAESLPAAIGSTFNIGSYANHYPNQNFVVHSIVPQQIQQLIPQPIQQLVQQFQELIPQQIQQIQQLIPQPIQQLIPHQYIPQQFIPQYALPYQLPLVQPTYIAQPQLYLPPTVAVESKLPVLDIPAAVEVTSVVDSKPYPPAVEVTSFVDSKPYPPAVEVVDSKPYAAAGPISHYGDAIIFQK